MVFDFENVEESDTIAVRSNGTDPVYLACLRLIAATTQRAERDAEAGSPEARAWLAWLRGEDDSDDGRRNGKAHRVDLNLKN